MRLYPPATFVAKIEVFPMNDDARFQKYTQAGPRYTSYPAVPHWRTEGFSAKGYQNRLLNTWGKSGEIALYIHLPYCESLCTFCACHKRITKNHSVEERYIDAVLKEWAMYRELLDAPPMIREFHIGGGTPSFFQPAQLDRLLSGIFDSAIRLESTEEYGWEGHPMNTTAEHLGVFYSHGFRRVSFGVQDYEPAVQQAIHRHQPFKQVKDVTEIARKMGYTSISHDLVYGLPFQTLASMGETIKKTLSLRPDRLSFYAYAHVPWIKGTGQRGFEDSDLPIGKSKRDLYDLGKNTFREAGYEEIGMDHFGLPGDPLLLAAQEGYLHRNFMGYTTNQAPMMISLGASAIGECIGGFVQNEKDIDIYLKQVESDEFPWTKGHLHQPKELQVRQLILSIMCTQQGNWREVDWNLEEIRKIELTLNEMTEDGLLLEANGHVFITPIGEPFLRNVCMAFDPYLIQNQCVGKQFSSTV